MPNENRALRMPWWSYVLALLGIVLVATGAVIGLIHPAMLVSPNAQIGEGVRIYAGYMASRNLAIAMMLVVLGATHARRSLALMFAFIGLVQFLDAIIDVWEKRWPIVPGVLVLAFIFGLGAAKLFPMARITASNTPDA